MPLCAGCGVHYDVKDPDPSSKIPGMKREVERMDKSNFPVLVKDLESDDPAVRMYAIQTLERLTGNRRGYEYYADEASREPAVARWRVWLAEQSAPGGKTTTSAAK
jgi:hypothetical protein